MAENMDRKLIASEEDNEREVRFVHNRYNIPMDVVMSAMLKVGKNGKPSRSRKLVYAVLREQGYVLTKVKPLPPAATIVENNQKINGEGEE